MQVTFVIQNFTRMEAELRSLVKNASNFRQTTYYLAGQDWPKFSWGLENKKCIACFLLVNTATKIVKH